MIDALPAGPDPANDLPAVFSQKAAAYVLAQNAMVPQINAVISALNALAAGGAYAIPYVVIAAAGADTDPGPGKINFTAASQNASSVLRVDVLGADSQDYSALLDTFDQSSSAVKGTLRIVKMGDPTKFVIFNITSRTAPGGYRNFYVTPVSSSAANPFATGDGVLLFFQRTGDMGATGIPSIPCVHVREEQSAGTSASGATTAGTNLYRRTLNTVKQNDIGATLSGNMLTLPAGKYLLRARATVDFSLSSAQTVMHRTAIYNQTDSSIAGLAINAAYTSSYSGNIVMELPVSEAVAIVTISAAKTFWVGTLTAASPYSWGFAANAGQPEIYTEFIAEKIG